MKERLKKWIALSPAERRTIVFLMIVLPIVDGGVRILGYARCRSLLTRAQAPFGWAGRGALVAESAVDAPRLARLVGIAALNGPYRAACLCRALTLWAMLKGSGVDARMKFGVRRQNETIEAHAWVECEGRVLIDRAHVAHSYAVLENAAAAEPSIRT